MADQDVFNNIWTDAVSEYEKRTERKIDKDRTFRDIGRLDDLNTVVEEGSERFGDFRNENRKLYSAMAKSIAPMEPWLQIIQKGMGSSPYAPACVVLGAASYLMKSCTTVSNAYDGVEELFEQMSEITTRLREYEHGGMEMSLQKKMTGILAYFLEIIGEAEACIRRKRFKQWARSVFTQKDTISTIVTKLRRYVEAELGLVIALTYRAAKETQTTARDTLTSVRDVKYDVDEVLTNQRSDRQRAFSEAEDKKLSEALKTKTTDEIASQHATNVEKLTTNTGHWIRDDSMFKAWEQEQAPILWVFGKPGVGKTMLAARTIEMLQKKYPQHSDIPSLTSVSYFSFKENDPALQDCAQFWKAAALQIANANDRFKKHVIATITRAHDTFASARRIWQKLFLDFFTEDTSARTLTSLAFIIVDGLDEGPQAERVKFLSCLADLLACNTNGRKCRIQIAVFARPDVRADPGFKKVNLRTHEKVIEITPERNFLDIEAYIRQRLGDVSVLKVLKRQRGIREFQILAKHIYKSVQTRSQGMFLWARLVFDQIRGLPSPEAIKESLQGAPQGLDDMLHHVFKRLEVDENMHRSYLCELLLWVFCAFRPLTVSELFKLLHVSAGQQCYMIEDDLRARYSSLFDLTGPLAEMEDEETGADTPPTDNSSDKDEFDFLEIPDSSDEDEIFWNDSAKSESDGKAAQLWAQSADSGKQGPSEDRFNFPRHWNHAIVSFSHARIRDYLAAEGNPLTRRWDDCSIIPENLKLKRLGIAMACFKIMNSEDDNEFLVSPLKIYAKINWIKHLVEVDFGSIDRPVAVQLAKDLASLFGDGQKMLQCSSDIENEFIQTWLSTSRFSSLVRKSISEHIDELDEGQRDWASSVKTSARALFRPLNVACASKWLTKTGWDDSEYLCMSEPQFSIMYAYSKLTDEGTVDGSVDTVNAEDAKYNILLEDIELIATNELVPKSEHWYTGVAWIMMSYDYTDRAIEYFTIAIDLQKSGSWIAMEGLARCYGKIQQYENAIRQMYAAIRNLPPTKGFGGVSFILLETIADWNLEIADEQKSIETAQQAYEATRGFVYGSGWATKACDYSILHSIKSYIEALFRKSAYNRITALLYELDRRETSEDGRSLWIVFLRAQHFPIYNVRVFAKVGKIVSDTGDAALYDFMACSITRLVSLGPSDIAEGDLPVWLAGQSAKWLYRNAPQPEESVALWERIVKFIDESNELYQQSLAWDRKNAAAFLGSIHFDAARSACKSGRDASAHITKLEELAQYKQGSKRYYRASYPALVLGMWLHEYAKAEDDAWRACFRPSVRKAIYLLTDEDPSNDQEAYDELGAALLFAGDILNASIAIGITMRPLEEQYEPPDQAVFAHDSQQDESVSPNEKPVPLAESPINFPSTNQGLSGPERWETQSPDIAVHGAAFDTSREKRVNPKYTGFELYWTCDGPCKSSQQSYTELYFCRICNDVCFCDKCLELVRTNQMPFRRCASDHPHTRMFPVTEEAKRMTDALVDERFEVQQEWLDGLKKIWDL